MEFYDVINSRRSIRRYKDIPVEKEKLQAVMNAAIQAPTWKNLQGWRVIIIGPESKDKILQSIPDTNPGKKGIASAPLVMVFCANPADSGERDGQNYYLVDSGIAMEHLVLAARNEGLGTCWMGIFDEAIIKTSFGIPEQWRVVAITPLGYPDQDPQPRPRKALAEMCFEGHWGNSVKN